MGAEKQRIGFNADTEKTSPPSDKMMPPKQKIGFGEGAISAEPDETGGFRVPGFLRDLVHRNSIDKFKASQSEQKEDDFTSQIEYPPLEIELFFNEFPDARAIEGVAQERAHWKHLVVRTLVDDIEDAIADKIPPHAARFSYYMNETGDTFDAFKWRVTESIRLFSAGDMKKEDFLSDLSEEERRAMKKLLSLMNKINSLTKEELEESDEH